MVAALVLLSVVMWAAVLLYGSTGLRGQGSEVIDAPPSQACTYMDKRNPEPHTIKRYEIFIGIDHSLIKLDFCAWVAIAMFAWTS